MRAAFDLNTPFAKLASAIGTQPNRLAPRSTMRTWKMLAEAATVSPQPGQRLLKLPIMRQQISLPGYLGNLTGL
ncbi:MAG: hypothetical protein P3W94_006650 [Paracoccus sp. (in: a-proteobacteria)]|nr:hypothetical protein [Paracoccus sp. (in: a-proteobacteria)]